MKAISWQHTLSILCFVGLVLSSNAQAVALGKIKLNSTQLQPLKLQVELAESEGVLPGSMTAKVAGPQQFAAAGLVYHPWYASLMVNLVGDAADLALQVEGFHAVQESKLDLIFEVDYLGGRLLAEYSVQLPGFAGQATVTETTQTKIAPPVVQPVVVVPPEPTKSALITVRPGQTLWRIAVNNTPDGISPWQSLMAFYSINQNAFKRGDIRYLIAGSELELPSDEQLAKLTAGQAKAQYDTLVKAKTKATVASEPALKKPIAASLEQQQLEQQQQLELQQQVTQLTSQSKQLQQQLLGLQGDNQSAVQAQQQLQQQNKALAQGVAAQQQDLVGLSQQRTILENNVLSLDQKFEATQESLNQAQTELLAVQQSLVQTQETAQLEQTINANRFDLKDISSLFALLLVSVLLLIGLVWWLVSRGRGANPHPIEPAVVDKAPLSLDPLADYNSKPSAKVADLQTSALQMQGMPERSFIEQLLLEQDQADLASNATAYGRPASLDDDHVHLSSEVEAMLNQRHQPQASADEPVDYLSPEDDMSTKLDLARSYRDMGQVSDAQALLEQVLKQGNADQQAQATLLLSRLK